MTGRARRAARVRPGCQLTTRRGLRASLPGGAEMAHRARAFFT